MSLSQSASLVLLVAILVLAIWRRMNIGVLALAASLPVLALSGLPAKTMYTAFPGEIFVLVAGVSLLFAHLERSGSLAWFVERVYRGVGDRHALLPWAGFLIAGALSTAGAFSTAEPTLPSLEDIGHVGYAFLVRPDVQVVIAGNSQAYSAVDAKGKTHPGTLEANNASDAAAAIKKQGMFPTNIAETAAENAKGKGKGFSLNFSLGGGGGGTSESARGAAAALASQITEIVTPPRPV
jgi:hypothetical protein